MAILTYLAMLKALQTPNVLSTLSPDSCGVEIAALQGGAPSSATWVTANTPVYVPFHLRAPATIKSMWVYNGSVVSGNINVGVLDSLGNVKVAMGSTAQVNSSYRQRFDVTDTALAAGPYYMAVVLDNTTGTLMFATATLAAGFVCGLLSSAANFALANTTYAVTTGGRLPIMGISTLATY